MQPSYRPLPTATSSWAASGAYTGVEPLLFSAWLPSSWPITPTVVTPTFVETLHTVFHEGMLDEIRNVIDDAIARNGSLEHRGHVLAIAIMCAIDSVAAFTSQDMTKGAQQRRFTAFIGTYVAEIAPYADDLYGADRNSLIHSWFLFRVAMSPDDQPISREPSGGVSVGLLTLHAALLEGVSRYLTSLASNPSLGEAALAQYDQLRSSAVA